ncbi:sensor histidine kinase [Nocardioides sp. GXZ039]|uniref:sensor histidine kinase n=1 Tax=Nocardioides sp. GXZ039 TaxID=3136018 RepID=UPI0030F40428
MRMRLSRISIGARVFTVIALAAPILAYNRSRGALVALGLLCLVWLATSVAERRSDLAPYTPLIEAAAVGAIAGASIDITTGFLLALALPPFIAAIRLGPRGCILAVCAELATVVLTTFIAIGPKPDDSQVLSIFSWTMAGLGFGLVGSVIHAGLERERAGLAPYLDAQHLIKQLLDLSDDLSSGLDVATLSGTVLSAVGDTVPTTASGLYLPRGEVLIPLAAQTLDRTDQSGLSLAEELAVTALTRGETVIDAGGFAFKVGDAAVFAGILPLRSTFGSQDLERLVGRIRRDLRTQIVQLDTALLFADFRDSASADVRKRLAREMHDGVAQDIASLGYLVDVLAARPADEKQAQQFAMLRGRITSIVAEVRQSVLTLRTSIGEAESLGTAIGAVARHLSESSQIPIHVTLDEHATRLRPEVEAELFRIAQEAMNNAIKHAQCNSIDVHCRVHAPEALITVTDDGRGLQKGRSDSHGLKIMRERARLVGAEISIGDRPEGGLAVAVEISHQDNR